uniref:Uncharacterized protein n=1 Tax=Globodera rostochiensis TaxID=31243 RepID=A0A914HN86_GLORO
MAEFWLLILVLLFATNSLDKSESVQLEELEEMQLQAFDELFVDEWWDKDEAEDLKTPAPTNFGQNVHHQIDRQNTQIGQIEPNSNDRNPPLTESDHCGQIEPNSTDRNPPLTEWKSELGQTEPKKYSHSEQKELMKRYYEIKDEISKIRDEDIVKMLNIGRSTLKAELKRAGFKNSYQNEINETVAKELGLRDITIYNWKRKLGQTTPNYKHPHSEQKELMKRYCEIKDQNPKIRCSLVVEKW